MKRIFLVLLIALSAPFCFAQKYFVDSLHHQLNISNEDTTRVLIFVELGNYYAFNQFDSAIIYGQKATNLATKLNYLYGSFLGLKCFFFAYNTQGNYPKALEVTLQSLKVAEKIKQETPQQVALASATYCLGVLNRQMNNLPVAIDQLQTSIELYNELYKESGAPNPDVFPAYSQLALIYQQLGRLDSALWFAQRGYDLSLQTITWRRFICLSSTVLGYVHTSLQNYDAAKKHLLIGARESSKVNNIFFLAWNYNLLANLFRKTNVLDSSIYYARMSLPLWRAHNFGPFAVNASTLLTQVYESQNKPDSTIKYMKMMIAAKDSVFNQSKVKEFEKFVFDEEKRKQDIQQEQEKCTNPL